MSGWHLIAGIVVAATGFLLFLRFVALDLAMASAALVILDKRERKAYRKRMEHRDAQMVEEGEIDVLRG